MRLKLVLGGVRIVALSISSQKPSLLFCLYCRFSLFLKDPLSPDYLVLICTYEMYVGYFRIEFRNQTFNMH